MRCSSLFPKTYRKFILTQFGDDFRACTKIIDTPWQDPGDDDVVVKNTYAGVNGVYDFNMMRNAVSYIKFDVPTDLGIESWGEKRSPDFDGKLCYLTLNVGGMN